MVAWSGFILPTSQLSSGWHHIAREAYDNNNNNRGSAIAGRPCDMLCQLKSCQILHNCMKNPIWKDLQYVNDGEGHSRSSELPPFNRSYITSCSRSVYIAYSIQDLTTLTVYVTASDLALGVTPSKFHQDPWHQKTSPYATYESLFARYYVKPCWYNSNFWQMHRHEATIYHANTASHGKNVPCVWWYGLNILNMLWNVVHFWRPR